MFVETVKKLLATRNKCDTEERKDTEFICALVLSADHETRRVLISLIGDKPNFGILSHVVPPIAIPFCMARDTLNQELANICEIKFTSEEYAQIIKDSETMIVTEAVRKALERRKENGK